MNDRYESPLASRYASAFMLELFSPQKRIETWRRLWVALARAEHELGLPITAEQVAALAAHQEDIDWQAVAADGISFAADGDAVMDLQAFSLA